MSFGEGTGTEFDTMRGRNYPSIRQFTVFLENRVGQLLEVVRRFEGSRVRVVALSITEFRGVLPSCGFCSAIRNKGEKFSSAPGWR